MVMAQNVEVSFSVNMTKLTAEGGFNPAFNFVDVAGTFNGWDGISHRLQDDDLDGIYQITIGGFTVGENIEFKFRIDGQWNGKEEFAGGGSNRVYRVLDANNDISVWYDDDLPAGAGYQIGFSSNAPSLYSGGVVEFTNTTVGEYTNTYWSFEGGVPASSTDKNPRILYRSPGNFDVTLIVTDGTVQDTLKVNDYTRVKERQFDENSWWNETVFYEIFVRSFQDSNGDGIGDFQGIIDRLDYLNDGDPETSDDLGITGLWLMPVNPSPSYHGYDVTDYKAVNPDYGTMEDFRQLVDEAHARGIRIIIDFVMNHTSRDHPWFTNSASSSSSEKRNWYRWSSIRPSQTGPWGQEVWHQRSSGYYYGLFWEGMPDLNYAEPQVQNEMFEAADFWLADVGIDGYRLDAVKYIIEAGQILEDDPATLNFWKDYQVEVKASKSDAFSVGEAWTSSEKVLNYVEDGGLDMCFEFDLAGSILNAVNNQDASGLISQSQKVYNLYPHNQFGTFLTNHDMNRVIEELGGSVEKNKSAAAIYLTLPGTPFVYYGEEIGMRGRKPDEFIRKPMQWSNSVSAGFTSGVPWIPVNTDFASVNVSSQQLNEASLWRWYRQLIHLRNDEEALQLGDYTPVYSADKKLFGFNRHFSGTNILVLINVSNQDMNMTDIDLSFTAWTSGEQMVSNLMDNTDVPISIDDAGMVRISGIKAREVKILKSLSTTPVEGLQTDIAELMVFPNPSHSWLSIHLGDETMVDDVFYRITDVMGRVQQKGRWQNNEAIDIGALPMGLYYISLFDNSNRWNAPFIKQ